MPQLTSPPVRLSMESYWQLVDVIKRKGLHLPFTSITQQPTPGISSATCQLLDILVCNSPPNQLDDGCTDINLFNIDTDEVQIVTFSFS